LNDTNADVENIKKSDEIVNEDTLKKANTELNQVTQQLEEATQQLEEATKNNNIIDRDKAEKIIEGLKELEEVLKERVDRYDTYLNWAASKLENASEKAAKRGGRRRKSTHRRRKH
jgi:hypothetical protein